jgi:hypothetical protein
MRRAVLIPPHSQASRLRAWWRRRLRRFCRSGCFSATIRSFSSVDQCRRRSHSRPSKRAWSTGDECRGSQRVYRVAVHVAAQVRDGVPVARLESRYKSRDPTRRRYRMTRGQHRCHDRVMPNRSRSPCPTVAACGSASMSMRGCRGASCTG